MAEIVGWVGGILIGLCEGSWGEGCQHLLANNVGITGNITVTLLILQIHRFRFMCIMTQLDTQVGCMKI